METRSPTDDAVPETHAEDSSGETWHHLFDAGGATDGFAFPAAAEAGGGDAGWTADPVADLHQLIDGNGIDLDALFTALNAVGDAPAGPAAADAAGGDSHALVVAVHDAPADAGAEFSSVPDLHHFDADDPILHGHVGTDDQQGA